MSTMQMYLKCLFHKLIFISTLSLLLQACSQTEQGKSKTQIALPKNSSVQSISKAIDNDPENAELYYQRSVLYFQSDALELALADVNDAIKFDSLMPLFPYFKGRIAYKMNRTLEAEAAYKKAVELKPDYEEALMKLAELYLVVKEHSKSIELLNRVLEVNKKNSDAYFFRGMNQKEIGDTPRAIASFQRALEIESVFYDAALQLGIILTAKKDKSAFYYLDAAIKSNKSSDEAYFARAFAHQEFKNYQKALTDYKKVIDLAPNNADAYYNVGIINMDVKQYKEALRSFDICIQMNPELLEAYYMRGKVHEKLGNKSDARLNYEYIIRSGVRFPEAEEALRRL